MAVMDSDMGVEYRDFAKAELDKLAKASESKKAKASEKSKAEYELAKGSYKVALGSGELMLASQVADKVGVSVQKAQAVLKKMVAEGVVEVYDVKVAKVGARKAYKLV